MHLKLELNILEVKIDYHKAHVIIAQAPIIDYNIIPWLKSFNIFIPNENLGEIRFKLDIGRRFDFLNVETLKTIKKILALTFRKLPRCSIIYQEWI
jgi:hypothetical protein